jgi:hypothetical protein
MNTNIENKENPLSKSETKTKKIIKKRIIRKIISNVSIYSE